MLSLITAALLASASFVSAASSARPLGPRPGQLKNLVTFGDSYTDVVSRFCCFVADFAF